MEASGGRNRKLIDVYFHPTVLNNWFTFPCSPLSVGLLLIQKILKVFFEKQFEGMLIPTYNPTLRSLRQEEAGFEASVSSTVSLSQ